MNPNRIPVLLVTGFLGSGKTSFINRLLRQFPQKKTALVLNEFGDVPFESQLIEQKQIGITEFSYGCLCHIPTGNIIGAVKELVEEQPDIDQIIFEASGLTDPFPVLKALGSPELKNLVELESAITVVDGNRLDYNLKQDHWLVSNQILFSGLVLLSKTEDFSPEALTLVKNKVKKIDSKAHVLRSQDFSSWDLLFASQKRMGEHLQDQLHQQHEDVSRDNQHGYESVLLSSDQSMDVYQLEHFLHHLPDGVIRAKGWYQWGWMSESPRFLINQVGSQLELRRSNQSKKKGEPTTAILLLGKELDESGLRQALNQCIWQQPSGLSAWNYRIKTWLMGSRAS